MAAITSRGKREPMPVCRDDMLCHYSLSGEEALPAILRDGLLPLSAVPTSDRWREIQRDDPDFYPSLYREFAKPVIHSRGA